MLRIGEFSALSSISINMLRHYDKIGLLIPKHVDQVSTIGRLEISIHL